MTGVKIKMVEDFYNRKIQNAKMAVLKFSIKQEFSAPPPKASSRVKAAALEKQDH